MMEAILSIFFKIANQKGNVQCLLVSLEDYLGFILSTPDVVYLKQRCLVARKQVYPFKLLMCQQLSSQGKGLALQPIRLVYVSSWHVQESGLQDVQSVILHGRHCEHVKKWGQLGQFGKWWARGRE